VSVDLPSSVQPRRSLPVWDRATTAAHVWSPRRALTHRTQGLPGTGVCARPATREITVMSS